MGCPAPPARPQLSGSCPLPSRFQTFRPGAPPPPGAAAAVPPPPVPRSVLPRNGGEGTPGPSIGGPGPPTPSLGPVAAPGRADVGAQREARALRPRNQPRPGAGPSPAEPGGAGAAGGPHAGPGRGASGAQTGARVRARARAGRTERGNRAGRGGRGWGRLPGTHQRGDCASRGRGPQSGGLMAGLGAGALASHPPSRRRLQSD